MPREKGIFWLEYELVKDNPNEPEKYCCKHCNTKYAKNASRLQNHLEKCINYQKKLIEEELINTMSNELTYKHSESDQKELENLLARAFYSAGMSFNIIENEDIKAVFQKDIPWFKILSRYRLSNTLLNQEYVKIKQLVETTLHRLQIKVYNNHISLLLPGDTRWGSVFYSAKNLLETKAAIQRITLEDNVKISDEIKNLILSDNFWFNLKILYNFLSPFAIFLKKLQTDQPTLSTVYSELCKLKISISENTEIPNDFKTNSISKGTERWNNFLYNPVIILAYKLDSQYQGKTLNPKKWDLIIEDELIRLVSSQDQEIILNEYAEYIALRILSIPPTSAACERNWSTFGFIHNKLRNRLNDPKVEKCVYIQWNLRILRDLGRIDELNKNIDFVEDLTIDNENLEENVFDDLFSDNELITYDENGCIDISSDS
ncbi:2135_t:CDS:2 [Dentiscutata erythropus]|uniref:2135_t:CDS:1 n=1 Tax=Dentiscutata erythropus TaxID=1348616 RepID=A0A9N9DAX3_9GLOM|nr:2135_t:CDS:2 [Dentiscutata erythropus]